MTPQAPFDAERLANISGRFSTPVNASVATGILIIALTWVYLLAASVQGAFDAVVNVSGLLFGLFYILTAPSFTTGAGSWPARSTPSPSASCPSAPPRSWPGGWPAPFRPRPPRRTGPWPGSWPPG